MGRPKLSQYFSPNFEPWQAGVYQTRQNKYEKPKFQYWNGCRWGVRKDTPLEAEEYNFIPANRQGIEANWWRGRANKP